jgi:radical SAM superfamily enzyme YgiQ (UPF0313 family)
MQKQLKIKLISPKMSLRPMDNEMKRRMSPSLTLVTIASLTPEPHYVYIEDENLTQINFNDSPDIVGISVNVDTTYRAFEISNQYRKRGTKVIFGGIHASANPDQMLEHCDAVCIGEAEEIWKTIIDDVLQNQLKPMYYHASVTDLNNYPIPNWNFISRKDYLYHNIVITSRGCPFKMVNSSLVFGFDFDTRDTFDHTLKWLIKNKVESMTSHILTPYPGTKLYDKLLKENRIIDFNLSHYNTSNVVFQPKNMTPAELCNGYLDMYRKFYSTRYIIKRKPLNNKLLLPYLMFNLGYRKWGRLTSLIGKMGAMNTIGKIARKLSYGIE